MTSTLNLKTIVSIKQDLITTDLEDQTVILNIEKNTYFNVSCVAKIIWDYLVEPISIANICKKLVERYDVELEVCQKEVFTFLKTLEEQEFLIIKNS